MRSFWMQGGPYLTGVLLEKGGREPRPRDRKEPREDGGTCVTSHEAPGAIRLDNGGTLPGASEGGVALLAP